MPKDRLIYLASPYSHSDPAVMQQRYEQVCEATAGLLRAGYMVYSPIVHSHPLTEYGLPTDWAYWERLDTRKIRACDELWVLALKGWEASTGVDCEMRIAKNLGMPVWRVEPWDCVYATGGMQLGYVEVDGNARLLPSVREQTTVYTQIGRRNSNRI